MILSFNIFYNVTMKATNKKDNPWRKSCKKRGTGIDKKRGRGAACISRKVITRDVDSLFGGDGSGVSVRKKGVLITSSLSSASNISKGGCLCEEKSHERWSLFTKFLSLVIAILFICKIKPRAIVCIDCTENQGKIGLSQMS